jgi:hypothetical protein
MRHFKVVLFVPLFVSFMLLAAGNATAQATATYTLNVDYCTTGCLFGGIGGAVTLNQVNSTDVGVSVSLNQVDFHGTGLQSFVFNLTGVTGSVSITSITAGFSNAGTGIHEDGAGTFGYGVNCALCGPQNGGTETVTLAFNVIDTNGITLADFNTLSSGGSPSAYFAAAVFNTTNTTCTGEIGANGSSTPTNGGSNNGTGACGGTPVPEPSSLAMLGWSGLIGLVPWVRRKLRI